MNLCPYHQHEIYRHLNWTNLLGCCSSALLKRKTSFNLSTSAFKSSLFMGPLLSNALFLLLENKELILLPALIRGSGMMKSPSFWLRRLLSSWFGFWISWSIFFYLIPSWITWPWLVYEMIGVKGLTNLVFGSRSLSLCYYYMSDYSNGDSLCSRSLSYC